MKGLTRERERERERQKERKRELCDSLRRNAKKIKAN